MTPDLPAILVKRTDAARMLGMGPRTFDRLRASGEIGPIARRVGGAVLFDVSELQEWSRLGCPDRLAWLEMKKTAAARRRAK